MADELHAHAVEVLYQFRIEGHALLARLADVVGTDRHHAHELVVEIHPQVRQAWHQRRRRGEVQFQLDAAGEAVAAQAELDLVAVAHAHQQTVATASQALEGLCTQPVGYLWRGSSDGWLLFGSQGERQAHGRN
ncbi:hypothetical protein D3C79_720100 [compost metagenome]